MAGRQALLGQMLFEIIEEFICVLNAKRNTGRFKNLLIVSVNIV
jgi:hypothetical protein